MLVLDREAMLEIGPAEVRFLCDRRAGIGGDGLLRAVLAKHIKDWPGDGSLWFMDYRNADGSVAEMCGNGSRVFARFLAEQGLTSSPVVPLATRSGLRETVLLPDGQVRVAMGPVAVTEAGVLVTASRRQPLAGADRRRGQPSRGELRGRSRPLALARRPRWEPEEAFPEGVNLEFVRRLGPRHVKLRVYERGWARPGPAAPARLRRPPPPTYAGRTRTATRPPTGWMCRAARWPWS